MPGLERDFANANEWEVKLTFVFMCVVDNADEIEEQRIFEEYKIWKKHAPFFYDTLYAHALTWPSLTVEWMPDRNTPYNSDWTVQRLLVGTHTSNDEQNYL